MFRSAGALAAAAALPWADAWSAVAPRFRVIIDNDFGGDPDGLFQLAHHLLSRSVKIPLVIGSHLHKGESWAGRARQASSSASKARELVRLLGLSSVNILAGSENPIPARTNLVPSPATAVIVAEAMRSDTSLPLFYAAGGGLTEIALAWLAEPRIGKRLNLVWIGGDDPTALSGSGNTSNGEYNLTIDLIAAQIIFNESDIEIWQVPRPTYRQMVFSNAELEQIGAFGPLGKYLKEQVHKVGSRFGTLGETYILGDSPLVTLTALQSSFDPDSSSSSYVIYPTPRIIENGLYEGNPAGRPMRVYRTIDTRLTFGDMVAKFRQADHLWAG